MLHAGTYYYCIIGKGQGFDLGALGGNSHGVEEDECWGRESALVLIG
jgi:hypothetical protein